MMRNILWAPGAKKDLQKISYWISRDNPVAANDVLDKIDQCAQKLALSPVGHKGRKDGTWEKVVVGLPYILVYSIDEEALYVLRIIHGARNWLAQTWPEENL